MKQRKGFTLIETIIYAGLFSVIISLVLVGVFQIIESQDRAQAIVETQEEANFIMRKIRWALLGVQSINQPLAGTTSSLLSVNKFNFGQNPVIFDVASDSIRLATGGGGSLTLNSRDVKIVSLVFEHIPQSGDIPPAIKTELTVEFNRDASTGLVVSSSLESISYLK